MPLHEDGIPTLPLKWSHGVALPYVRAACRSSANENNPGQERTREGLEKGRVEGKEANLRAAYLNFALPLREPSGHGIFDLCRYGEQMGGVHMPGHGYRETDRQRGERAMEVSRRRMGKRLPREEWWAIDAAARLSLTVKRS